MSLITFVVLGLLGLSTGIPVEKSFNPQDFYQPSSSRILGGSEAPEGSALHMVAIVFGELVKSFNCGGTLVTRKCVITAAHCIDSMVSWIDGQMMSSVRGQIGSNSLSGGYTTIRFSGHENHPDWDNRLIKNDVGLMNLTEPLPKDAQAKPIPINFKWVGGEETLRVFGWGVLSVWGAQPDRLQQLQKDTLSPEDCEEWMREANAQLGSSPPVDRATALCTTHKRGAGWGVCFGDSGSALLNADGFMVALVSWGFPCALGPPFPDVHARMSGFKKWLRLALAHAGDDIEE